MPPTLAVFLRFSLAWLLIFCGALTIFGCQPSAPAPDVVANSDLGPIHRQEVETRILSLPEDRRNQSAGQSVQDWHREIVEEMIVERVLEHEAETLDLAGSEDGEALLAGRIDTFLAQTMGDRLIAGKVDVTEEDLRAFFDANPGEFSHPRQVRVRNIYRRVDREALPDQWHAARKEMEDLLGQIQRGARFEDLAREHSDSETARLDGLIGRLDRGKMNPEIEEVLWSLDEGEVSDIIRTPVGFQIFKVETHLDEYRTSFEEARARLSRRLVREATEAAGEDVLKELLDASGATFNPQKLVNGSPDDVLFSNDGEDMTLGSFRQRLESIGFFDARDLPLRTHLDNAARERLCLWWAREVGLADEDGIKTRIDQIEHETKISLAKQRRAREMIETLDEGDLEDLYVSRQKRFYTPRLLHLTILVMDFPTGRDWYAVYEELEQIAREIRAGDRDFADTARELSTDLSAPVGGDVGAIRSEALASWAGPSAQEAVLKMAPGEVSEPILIERFNTNRLTYERVGYMLVRLEEILEPRLRTFDEARDAVIDQYSELHSEELSKRMRTEILDSVHAEIYSENL